MSPNEVDAWFEEYNNPLKAEVQRVREIILAADERMQEVESCSPELKAVVKAWITSRN